MRIRLDLDDAPRRLLRATLEVDVEPGRAGCELMLPVWTPGSYVIREYSRHVTGFVASDAEDGRRAEVTKTAKNRYAVHVPEGAHRIRVRYAIYAHELSVRTSHVTEDWAYWNGASAYFWPVGREGNGALLEVGLPDGWELFSGLQTRTEREGRTARIPLRDLDEAVDTPFLAGRPDVVDFEVRGTPFRFVFAGLSGIRPPDPLVEDTGAIVEAATAIFDGGDGGELPVPEYTFLSLHTDKGRGGLEHATSSTLLAPRTTFRPRRRYEEYLGLVAHEFFHVFSGKRMRPAELWEIDYERENHTALLWVVEGFTSYYDDHLCLRAGVLTPRRYLEIVARNVREMRAKPGRFAQSLGEASYDAWIRFYRPDENTPNATQNYYTNGALLGLVVDAAIRRRSGGARSLDDAMRSLWQTTYLERRGYTEHDVGQALNQAAGTELDGWLTALVDGSFDPDIGDALSSYGLRIVTPPPGDHGPHLGLLLRAGELRVQSVLRDGPAWHAGLCPDDEILGVADLRVTRDSWDTVLDNVATADQPLTLCVARQGRILSKTITPAAHSDRELSIESVESPDAAALRLREAWLGTVELR